MTTATYAPLALRTIYYQVPAARGADWFYCGVSPLWNASRPGELRLLAQLCAQHFYTQHLGGADFETPLTFILYDSKKGNPVGAGVVSLLNRPAFEVSDIETRAGQLANLAAFVNFVKG